VPFLLVPCTLWYHNTVYAKEIRPNPSCHSPETPRLIGTLLSLCSMLVLLGGSDETTSAAWDSNAEIGSVAPPALRSALTQPQHTYTHTGTGLPWPEMASRHAILMVAKSVSSTCNLQSWVVLLTYWARMPNSQMGLAKMIWTLPGSNHQCLLVEHLPFAFVLAQFLFVASRCTCFSQSAKALEEGGKVVKDLYQKAEAAVVKK
jgi:hypothetical protein